MLFQKRPQVLQEFVLCSHDGRMVSGQFQPLDNWTLRGENFVNAAMQRDRVFPRDYQNQLPKALQLIDITLQLPRSLKGLEELLVGPPTLAKAHSQPPVFSNHSHPANTENESID